MFWYPLRSSSLIQELWLWAQQSICYRCRTTRVKRRRKCGGVFRTKNRTTRNQKMDKYRASTSVVSRPRTLDSTLTFSIRRCYHDCHNRTGEPGLLVMSGCIQCLLYKSLSFLDEQSSLQFFSSSSSSPLFQARSPLSNLSYTFQGLLVFHSFFDKVMRPNAIDSKIFF